MTRAAGRLCGEEDCEGKKTHYLILDAHRMWCLRVGCRESILVLLYWPTSKLGNKNKEEMEFKSAKAAL